MGQDIGQAIGAAGGTRRGTDAHRLLARWLVATGVAVAALMLSSPSAHALSQQGHAYTEKLGEGLSQPSAVAVDESTGDVYVLDTSNNRVMVYAPEPAGKPGHKFLEAWGYDVKAGSSSGELEQCKAPEPCQAGAPGFGKGQFDSPVAIAVDNASGSPSHGDVYVVANESPTKAVVDEFSGQGHLPAGRLIRRLITKEEDETYEEDPVLGVAVEASGPVLVEREDEEEQFDLFRFNSSSEAPSSPRPAEEADEGLALLEEHEGQKASTEGDRPARPGFAVNASGDVYVTYEPGGSDYELRLEEEEEILEREKERKHKHEEPAGEKVAGPCEAHRCFVAELAIVGSGASAQTLSLTEELDRSNSTGVAVDLSSGLPSSGDVYLDNATSIAAFGPVGTLQQGSLIQRFGADEPGGEPLQAGRGIAVDAATDQVLVPDAAAGWVDVYGPEPSAPPTVTGVSATNLTSSSEELRAQVNPEGRETSYYFQYGTSSCTEGHCADAPVPPGTQIGKAFGDQPVSLAVEGLSPNTTYHFRVIATSTNEAGEEAKVTTSREATFTTFIALPDKRAWELVSPEKNDGATVAGLTHEGGLIQAAANGEAISYLSSAPTGEEVEGNRGPEPSQILSRHEADGGWASQDITTKNRYANGDRALQRSEYQAFSPDLSVALLEPVEVLSELTGRSFERTVYLRDDVPKAPEPAEAPIYELPREVAREAALKRALEEGEGKEEAEAKATADAELTPGYLSLLTDGRHRAAEDAALEGATPDLSHIVLSSLEPQPQAEGVSGEETGKGGLYEWSSNTSQLQLVDVLPDGKQAPSTAKLAKTGLSEGARHGISESCSPQRVAEGCSPGDRVVFYDQPDNHLYLREVGKTTAEGKTLQIDAPNSGAEVPELGGVSPVFQTANAEDTRIFFSDPQQLTSNALNLEATETSKEATEPTEQLYAYEPDKAAGERLTDVAPSLNENESPEVLGGVIGASEDGSTVYFVANGVLAANEARGERAEPGHCSFEAPRWGTCNLYVSNYDTEDEKWTTTFIANLSSEDLPDWGENEEDARYDLYAMTSRVSPNGEHLAFMSDRPLTGYENTDARSGARDEEVFLYNRAANQVVCASCNPSGARPVGVHDVELAGEGRGLLADRPETWSGDPSANVGQDSWLAANIPGWTGPSSIEAMRQPRYLSDEGRLFFNSADALVPLAKPTRKEKINGKEEEVGLENVYEYEPTGVGGCQSENTEGGCVALISSGTSEKESAFMEASENGEDVFFLTSEKLSPLDTEPSSYGVYDARVCPEAGCQTPSPPEPPVECNGIEECHGHSGQSTTFEAPATEVLTGSGNISVLGKKEEQKPKPTPKPKAPTRAELLAKTLKSCRTKFKAHSKRGKRLACEKQARRKYGAKKASKAGRASAKRSSRSAAAARRGR